MKIGIIGAMDVEVAYLKEVMDITETRTVAKQDYCAGKIGNTDVVVVQCGIGKVRAGMSAQVLCDLFHVTHIINTGVAGSLNADIDIGDIVVSNDAVFHDVHAVDFGYEIGEMPQLGTKYFVADEQLKQNALKAIREVASDIKAFEGRIATGDQFVSKKDKKDWIRQTFQADCTEMEGGAIAECAMLNDVPFVILRAISDKADETASETYDVFESKAAKHCAEIVKYMIENMNA